MSVKLTADQLAILQSRSFSQGDGYSTANWIAEECGHFYETSWASARIPGLIKRGLIERGSKGWYRLADAGRAAIEAHRAAALEAFALNDAEEIVQIGKKA